MVNEQRNEYVPDYAVPPGEVLEYELELRHMPKSELAHRTGLTEKHINTIVKSKGKSCITPETAIKLERALGMPADYWLKLETNYQEACTRLAEEKALEASLNWLNRIPVAAMAKLGWLAKHRDKKAQLVEVLRFFGIASVNQWEQMWPRLAVADRQHTKQGVCQFAVSAWLRQGELEAKRIDCAPYDKAAFRAALDEVRALTAEPNPDQFVPALQARCAAAGVAVVFTPALPKMGINGATRWLHAEKAIIQLSLHYKSNDHLWFAFFHEAGHILLHGKKALFLEVANGTSFIGMDADKEAEANAFAEQELIPRSAFKAFTRRAAFSEATIRDFAQARGVAPGIVVGQLQHKGLLPPSHCNDLKVRYQWNADNRQHQSPGNHGA